MFFSSLPCQLLGPGIPGLRPCTSSPSPHWAHHRGHTSPSGHCAGCSVLNPRAKETAETSLCLCKEKRFSLSSPNKSKTEKYLPHLYHKSGLKEREEKNPLRSLEHMLPSSSSGSCLAHSRSLGSPSTPSSSESDPWLKSILWANFDKFWDMDRGGTYVSVPSKATSCTCFSQEDSMLTLTAGPPDMMAGLMGGRQTERFNH